MDYERPIEKLLRRYAKKRRDDPAATRLEMHPATRRLLQSEVSRQFPKPAASGAKPVVGLKSLWPRLVWALPVLVVLMVGVWAIVQSKKPQSGVGNLAKAVSSSSVQLSESLERTETPAQSLRNVPSLSEPAPRTLANADASLAKDTSTLSLEEGKLKTDHALASPALSTPAAEVAKLDTTTQEKAVTSRDALDRLAPNARADKSRDLTLTARRAPASEPVASAGQRPETVRAVTTATPTDSLGVAPGIGGQSGTARFNRAGPLNAQPPIAAAPPMSISATPTLTKIEADRLQVAPPTVVQKFVQTTAVPTSGSLAKKSAAMPPVLEAFQVEQTGNQLRVIDSDGSSYNGSIQFATAEVLYDTEDENKRTGDFKNTRLYRQVVNEKLPEAQAGQNYFFSVSGTNRTLKQSVAFTGNLLVLTNVLPATQNGIPFAPAAKSQFLQNQTASPVLLNSSISGKVQLGTDKEMQINAMPVSR